MEFFVFNEQGFNEYNNGNNGEVYSKLHDSKLHEIFKKILVVYPQRLTHEELQFLQGLATKAEYFYSLGIDRESYEKIQNLTLDGITILVDTNFLYSVLNLHIHRDNAAVQYIMELSQKKIINIDIKYLKITFLELKKAEGELLQSIDKSITNPKHIRALINSGDLDEYTQNYFSQKLVNSTIPHPSEKVKNAIHILNHKGIEPYRASFGSLDAEDQNFMNARLTSYYDFENKFNSWRAERGYTNIRQKHSEQIFHDVYYREAIKNLRKRQTEQNIRYIGLTLDNSLIKYDHYEIGISSIRTSEIITPIFFSPTIFLKKIRSFIPLDADDYTKAFLSSVTASTFNTSDRQRSITAQKTISYFKDLGIDDEETILNIIKQEVFWDEFEKTVETDTAQDFISSEVNKQIDLLKAEKARVSEELRTVNNNFTEKVNFVNQKVIEAVEMKEATLKTVEHEYSERLMSKQQIIDQIQLEKTSDQEKIAKLQAEKENFLKEAKEKENESRLIKRKEYISKEVSHWRLKSWMEFLACLAFILASLLYLLYGSNWDINTSSINAKTLKENYIVAIIVFLLSAYFNIVVLRTLSDKYRNHSNIKNFKDSIDVPIELQNII